MVFLIPALSFAQNIPSGGATIITPNPSAKSGYKSVQRVEGGGIPEERLDFGNKNTQKKRNGIHFKISYLSGVPIERIQNDELTPEDVQGLRALKKSNAGGDKVLTKTEDDALEEILDNNRDVPTQKQPEAKVGGEQSLTDILEEVGKKGAEALLKSSGVCLLGSSLASAGSGVNPVSVSVGDGGSLFDCVLDGFFANVWKKIKIQLITNIENFIDGGFEGTVFRTSDLLSLSEDAFEAGLDGALSQHSNFFCGDLGGPLKLSIGIQKIYLEEPDNECTVDKAEDAFRGLSRKLDRILDTKPQLTNKRPTTRQDLQDKSQQNGGRLNILNAVEIAFEGGGPALQYQKTLASIVEEGEKQSEKERLAFTSNPIRSSAKEQEELKKDLTSSSFEETTPAEPSSWGDIITSLLTRAVFKKIGVDLPSQVTLIKPNQFGLGKAEDDVYKTIVENIVTYQEEAVKVCEVEHISEINTRVVEFSTKLNQSKQALTSLGTFESETQKNKVSKAIKNEMLPVNLTSTGLNNYILGKPIGNHFLYDNKEIKLEQLNPATKAGKDYFNEGLKCTKIKTL